MGTALQRARQILENDKDFEYLHTEANLITTGTMWDATAEEVVDTWNETPYFHKMYIEEYIARYKATLFFAIAISKLLDTIHVEDDEAFDQMQQIPGTDKLVNIYTSPRPWVKRFRTLDKQGRLCPYVEEDVWIGTPAIGLTQQVFASGYGSIKFILEEPVLILDPRISEYKIKYLDSLVRIEIEDNRGGILFAEMHLRDLNINKVLKTINSAGLM